MLRDGADRHGEREQVERAVGPVLAAGVHDVVGEPDGVEALSVGETGFVKHGVDAAVGMELETKLHENLRGAISYQLSASSFSLRASSARRYGSDLQAVVLDYARGGVLRR